MFPYAYGIVLKQRGIWVVEKTNCGKFCDRSYRIGFRTNRPSVNLASKYLCTRVKLTRVLDVLLVNVVGINRQNGFYGSQLIISLWSSIHLMYICNVEITVFPHHSISYKSIYTTHDYSSHFVNCIFSLLIHSPLSSYIGRLIKLVLRQYGRDERRG